MKFPSFGYRSTPWFILLLCALSYALLVPWLGFYWDDWPSIWFLHFLGPAGFRDVFSVDRPLLGQLFSMTTVFLGESMLAWQIFAILTRFLSAISLWWMLRQVWPNRPLQVGAVAVLFSLYPGFTQGFIAVTFSHVFILQAVFWFSIGAMLWGLRRPNHFWPAFGISLLTSALTMFTVEYFFGLELIRPVLLWIVLSEDEGLTRRERITRVVRLFLPYILVIGGFLYWRFAVHQTVRGSVTLFERISQEPVDYSLELAGEILMDVFQSGLWAWLEPLNPQNFTGNGVVVNLTALGVGLLAAGLSVIYWLGRDKDISPIRSGNGTSWAFQAIPVGLLSLGLGGWPFWTTNLPIALRFPWDRFTLALMLGSCLIMVGLVELVSRKVVMRVILLSSLIGLASGYHFLVANSYRLEWNRLKEFTWQLTWRAPDIETGTLLVTSGQPYFHITDNSLTAPINWTYAPSGPTSEMHYLVFDIGSRLGGSLPDIRSGIEIEQIYRDFTFRGSTDQALVYYYEPPGCVKVVDPRYDSRLPQLPRYISDATSLSDTSLILSALGSNQARPPEHILGPEPEHNWCYYFEKAELARQNGDWQRVHELGEAALALDIRLYPVNAPELLPYIEAYLRAAEWEQAYELSMSAYHLTPRINRSLCDTWERSADPNAADPQAQEYIDRLGEICHELE